MPGKSFVGKLLINIVFIIVFLSPYIYGYSQYREALFTPSYSPPRIDFQSNIAGYRLVHSKLYVIMELDNKGEVNITVSNLNASIYTSNGDYITDLKLDKPVEVDAGTKMNITFYMQFTLDTMMKLFKALISNSNLSVKGILGIEVYSSKVEYPLDIPLSLPEDILKSYMEKFEISYVGSEIKNDTIEFKIEVKNPFSIDFRIIDSDLKLYTIDGDYISDISVEKNAIIYAGSNSYINLHLNLTPEIIQTLIRYGSGDYKIVGTLVMESMNMKLPVEVNIGFKLDISRITGG